MIYFSDVTIIGDNQIYIAKKSRFELSIQSSSSSLLCENSMSCKTCLSVNYVVVDFAADELVIIMSILKKVHVAW